MAADELLAVLDERGVETGVKTRAQVHRDHDWHWLVLVWAAHLDAPGRARTLLQIRARPGDPFQGNLDAPAGGHVNAAETPLQGALREFCEEVGVELQAADLIHLDEYPLVNHSGKCRRVIQHFYLCCRPIDLRTVRFNEEVSGFVEVCLEDFVDLLEGRQQSIQGRGRFAEQPDTILEKTVEFASFASYSAPIQASFRRSMRQILTYLQRSI